MLWAKVLNKHAPVPAKLFRTWVRRYPENLFA